MIAVRILFASYAIGSLAYFHRNSVVHCLTILIHFHWLILFFPVTAMKNKGLIAVSTTSSSFWVHFIMQPSPVICIWPSKFGIQMFSFFARFRFSFSLIPRSRLLIHPLSCTSHPGNIVFHLVQSQLLGRRIPRYPCALILFVHVLHIVGHNQLLQCFVLLILQDILSMKHRSDKFRCCLQRLQEDQGGTHLRTKKWNGFRSHLGFHRARYKRDGVSQFCLQQSMSFRYLPGYHCNKAS